ncbi:hypothetical protein KFK09_016718 [Dendrobium nobile]|uniref:Secreted protein n=1 Tax=Dendrobium nobile TaxID=94219 RepID=A0A8T3AZ16_DENNO|nr:hypothetical protein KFK09_016718 [Dendrobium nobile]
MLFLCSSFLLFYLLAGFLQQSFETKFLCYSSVLLSCRSIYLQVLSAKITRSASTTVILLRHIRWSEAWLSFEHRRLNAAKEIDSAGSADYVTVADE